MPPVRYDAYRGVPVECGRNGPRGRRGILKRIRCTRMSSMVAWRHEDDAACVLMKVLAVVNEIPERALLMVLRMFVLCVLSVQRRQTACTQKTQPTHIPDK